MDFFDALVRYETDLWNLMDDRLATSGCRSLATVFALRVVRRHGGAGRVQDLRSDLGITVGAASKLVDRLERDGLAVRRGNPGDRRSSLVDLTPVGHEQLEQGLAVLQEGLAGHLDQDPDHDPGIATMTAALLRLDGRLRAGTTAAAS